MQSKDQAFFFLGKFLTWYKDSFGQPGETIRTRLIELVKEAEDIHKTMLEEISDLVDKKSGAPTIVKLDDIQFKDLKKKKVKKLSPKRISKYL